jgi:hypothetical protein
MRRERLVASEQAILLVMGGDAVVTTSPNPRPATAATTIEPALLDLVLHHDELSLGAKTIVIYVLTQPHPRVIPRAELERLGGAATSHHLDGLLHEHELVAAHWLMPVPAEERPCCADGFLLREDADEDDPQTPIAASAARSSARDGNDSDLNDAPPHVTRPGAGIAW